MEEELPVDGYRVLSVATIGDRRTGVRFVDEYERWVSLGMRPVGPVRHSANKAESWVELWQVFACTRDSKSPYEQTTSRRD